MTTPLHDNFSNDEETEEKSDTADASNTDITNHSVSGLVRAVNELQDANSIKGNSVQNSNDITKDIVERAFQFSIDAVQLNIRSIKDDVLSELISVRRAFNEIREDLYSSFRRSEDVEHNLRRFMLGYFEERLSAIVSSVIEQKIPEIISIYNDKLIHESREGSAVVGTLRDEISRLRHIISPSSLIGGKDDLEEEMKHLFAMRRELRKRLFSLEIEQAKKGIDTPPQVETQISDIRERISEVEARIKIITPVVNEAKQ